MSVQKVREYLKKYGMENRLREFPVSSATVALAAQALQVEEARIAKTISFLRRRRMHFNRYRGGCKN